MAGHDSEDSERARAARYLLRLSSVTRGIGIIACIGAVITIVIAMGMRSSSDQVGFTLTGLAVLLFGILVWATGAFHGAVGRALPTLFTIDRKLDTIARELGAREIAITPSAVDGPPTEPMPEAPPGALTPGPAPAPAPEPERDSGPEPTAAVRRIEPAPEIVKTPCPHCGGLIHPEATRCVHCMKKVA